MMNLLTANWGKKSLVCDHRNGLNDTIYSKVQYIADFGLYGHKISTLNCELMN